MELRATVQGVRMKELIRECMSTKNTQILGNKL